MRLVERWLPSLSALSPEQRWQARLLVEVLAIAAIASGGLAVILAFSGDWLSAIECALLAAAMPAGALVVRRTGAVHVVADVLLALTAVIFAVAALLESRLDGAGICWLGIVPFFGVLLRGPRSLFVWGPFAVLTALAMYLKPEGALPSFELSALVPPVRAAGLLVLLVLAALSFTRTRARLAHELERASTKKSELLAVVSRELRAPLEGIVGTTELLLRRVSDPQLLERLAVVARSGDALVALIGDILDIDQVERGTLKLDAVDFDLRALVSDVVALYQPSAARKGVSLAAEVAEHVPPRLHGPSGRLRQVLSNLVSNALKFTDRGHVRILVRPRAPVDPAGPRLDITVEDTGCGISAASLPRLFRPFEQGTQAAARRSGGTGLGLALCRELVSLMGGTLRVESQAGAGSRFAFDVPLALPLKKEEAAPEGSRPPSPVAGSPPAAERHPPFRGADEPGPGADERAADTGERGQRAPVLVVDDNAVNREVACEMLRELGWMFRAVDNAVDAVAAVEREPFSAVLMDCRMPDVDGLEATRRIRSLGGRAARTPIIALTASALPDELRRCREAGMHATLIKPLSVAALERALDEACGPRSRPSVGD